MGKIKIEIIPNMDDWLKNRFNLVKNRFNSLEDWLKNYFNTIKHRYNSTEDLSNDRSINEFANKTEIESNAPNEINKYPNINSNKDAHSCKCDVCEKVDFLEYRYKCLICENYDQCGKCFESRKINQNHFLSHPMVRFDFPDELYGLKMNNEEINLLNFANIFKMEVHKKFRCNFCSLDPIRGLRLKCDVCNNFDLCFDCFKKNKSSLDHSSKDHPLIVFGKTYFFEINENDIENMEELGRGGFGSVYKSKVKNLDKIVACKVITIYDQNMMGSSEMNPQSLYKSYIQELNAYNELKGVNILRMFGNFIQKTHVSTNLMIITEFMNKGSLESLLEKEPNLTYRRRFEIACDIAAGMARIHEHQFIHRDIRPDNVLIDSNYTAKIGDMGIAKLMPPQMNRNTLIGCPPFMPPEFHTGNYDQKLDIFTFGLTFNIIFNGRHNENDRLRHYEIIRKADLFRDYIQVCVSPDPVKRPTSKNISEKFLLLRKLIDQEIFTKEMFPVYKNMSCIQKNEHFKILHDKYLNNKRAFNIEI